MISDRDFEYYVKIIRMVRVRGAYRAELPAEIPNLVQLESYPSGDKDCESVCRYLYRRSCIACRATC